MNKKVEKAMKQYIYHSPIGLLKIAEKAQKITEVCFVRSAIEYNNEITPLLMNAYRALDRYFHGEKIAFSLPLAPAGSTFEKKVWCALQKVPFGETRTYRQIAKEIGCPNACRAVGRACGKNPIAILIPCHRIIGSDGKLTGYAGGLDRKKYLLALEKGDFSASFPHLNTSVK